MNRFIDQIIQRLRPEELIGHILYGEIINALNIFASTPSTHEERVTEVQKFVEEILKLQHIWPWFYNTYFDCKTFHIGNFKLEFNSDE